MAFFTAPLHRRTLLRGLGTTMALPFLEAMLPRFASAAPGSPKRFVAFYTPCGIHMQDWTPQNTGAGYTATPILSALVAAGIKDNVNVLTGLKNDPARPDGAGDHASGTGGFLTAAHPFKTSGANIKNGISVDQVIANALKGKTKFPSLELGVDGGAANGDCDSGYSCAYARNIAWAGDATPIAKETNPGQAFDRLFAGVDPNQNAAAAAKRKKDKQSVIDAVKSDADRITQKVGTADKKKIDEYLTGVRTLEKRLQDDTGGPTVCGPSQAKPTSANNWQDIRPHSEAMFDIIKMAFECDLTRVVTFMLQNAGSGYVHRFLQVDGSDLSRGHHDLSHHQKNDYNFRALSAISKWEVEQYAKLCAKLKSSKDGDGNTMLDNSYVFFSSEITDGDAHNHDNMPVLFAGKAGGIATGRHLRFNDTPPLANLYVHAINACGGSVTKFGDSTGSLPL